MVAGVAGEAPHGGRLVVPHRVPFIAYDDCTLTAVCRLYSVTLHGGMLHARNNATAAGVFMYFQIFRLIIRTSFGHHTCTLVGCVLKC